MCSTTSPCASDIVKLSSKLWSSHLLGDSSYCEAVTCLETHHHRPSNISVHTMFALHSNSSNIQWLCHYHVDKEMQKCCPLWKCCLQWCVWKWIWFSVSLDWRFVHCRQKSNEDHSQIQIHPTIIINILIHVLSTLEIYFLASISFFLFIFVFRAFNERCSQNRKYNSISMLFVEFICFLCYQQYSIQYKGAFLFIFLAYWLETIFKFVPSYTIQFMVKWNFKIIILWFQFCTLAWKYACF
jgi:hypothetical protein